MTIKKANLIISNAAELVTLSSHPCLTGRQARCGVSEMNALGIINNGAVAIKNGKIMAVGSSNDILKTYSSRKIIKATGKTVTPGLIDAHTHPIFMGDRADEFELKLKGATYQKIAASGGGIKSTVQKVRRASKNELKNNAQKYLKRFLSCGTTTIEAKSGYGLTTNDEIKILEVIKELSGKPIYPDMVATFLGAHEIPDEFKDNKTAYVNLIKTEMIPLVTRKRLAEFCDVFCEKGVFEIDESRQILKSAVNHKLGIKLHADEFTRLGGAELAAEMNATSADHLMFASDKGLTKMKEKGVIAVLLPGTTFMLGLKTYAPARKMIDMGIPVALATDFNPGTSMTESLPIIMTIACVMMKMTPAEVLTATTINAAYAVKREKLIGSLDVNKQADIVIWDTPSYKHIAYHFGVNLIDTVIKKGIVSYSVAV
ncbi:MAG: imidazolonepropionase [Planctomycetota bacterium]